MPPSPITSSIVHVAPGMTHAVSRSSNSDCDSTPHGGTIGITKTLNLVGTPSGWDISSSGLCDLDEEGKKGLAGDEEDEDEEDEDDDEDKHDVQEERQEQESEHVDCKGVEDDQHHHVTPFVFSSFSKEVRDATPPSFDLPKSLLSFMGEQQEESMVWYDTVGEIRGG